MTANLQRALRLLEEDGYPQAQWAGGGSPQGTVLWSFRGDDDGGGVSGGVCGGGGGGADGLLRDSMHGTFHIPNTCAPRTLLGRCRLTQRTLERGAVLRSNL